MWMLAWANLTYRKVRSILSAFAVAIAIMLLLVLIGLSEGTLNEVSRRMESVQAEILVRDRDFDLGSISGGKLWEKEIPAIKGVTLDDRVVVRHVVPVFLGRLKVDGMSQNVFGVHPGDFSVFAGDRRIIAGELFTDTDKPTPTADPTAGLAEPLPILIDQRLSEAGDLGPGDEVPYAGGTARITGVVETGVAGRVFAPINRLRQSHGITAHTAHMFFVKTDSALSSDQLRELCERIEAVTHRNASLVAQYGQVLADNFRHLTLFMHIVSVMALVICFLFIIVTMYTMVLEQQRSIAVLQSLGAGPGFILKQTIHEALLICTTGMAAGIAGAYGVRWLILSTLPLMNVDIRWPWLVTAVVLSLLGGTLSALYPGYMALRHDPVEILSSG